MRVKKILINSLLIIAGTLAGFVLGYFLITKTTITQIKRNDTKIADILKPPKKIVIGFLPFWLIDRAQEDYSKYITQLSYFNVVIDADGTIQKYTAPGESDPGWHSLFTGKVDNYLKAAKEKGLDLSLTVFSASDNKIDMFLTDPAKSAENLATEISPILTEYGFNDLNLDIEKVADSTPDQRARYVDFVREMRSRIDPNVTITVDVVATSFVRDVNLCNPKELAKVADYIVLMGYDFHNPGSYVTGPVAPQGGAGVINEFDIESAVRVAKTIMPSHKLVLAIPLYGYSWETINPYPRAATMPGSAYSISSRLVDELLQKCATCSAEIDKTAGESYIVYKNENTGLYHQIFYPDKQSTQIKVDFANTQNLGGIALWALGYEGKTILDPLVLFRR